MSSESYEPISYEEYRSFFPFEPYLFRGKWIETSENDRWAWKFRERDGYAFSDCWIACHFNKETPMWLQLARAIGVDPERTGADHLRSSSVAMVFVLFVKRNP